MARRNLAYYEEVSKRVIRYSAPVLGLAEFAQMLGQMPQQLSNSVKRKSRSIPKPDYRLAMGPVWTKETVLKWLLEEVERFI